IPAGVKVEADAETGDIHLVTGPTFRGVQFHAESILTENGFTLLRQLLLELLGQWVAEGRAVALVPEQVAQQPSRSARNPGVLVVDHYDSYTWNLVHLIA